MVHIRTNAHVVHVSHIHLEEPLGGAQRRKWKEKSSQIQKKKGAVSLVAKLCNVHSVHNRARQVENVVGVSKFRENGANIAPRRTTDSQRRQCEAESKASA